MPEPRLPMIVLITTRRHRYTLARLKPTEHRFPVPRIRRMSYDALFRSIVLPRATYIFSDFDRINPWQQRVAADYFRILSAAGMRCLNDPARVMTRFELLAALHREGINPQAVYRADAFPEPAKFPVFVRHEDHGRPVTPLLQNQSELDAALRDMREGGIPLRGALVMEFCAQEYRPGLWNKWGAFRVGDRYSLDHISIEENWLVKYGTNSLMTDEILREEQEAAIENRYVEQLKPAFELAGIEYGRADFSIVDGRPVIYEINTNPYKGKFVPDKKRLRCETEILGRRRFSEMLSEVDTSGSGYFRIQPSSLIKFRRGFWPGFLPHEQP